MESIKKIEKSIAKNNAILILLNRAQFCELMGCVNQMGEPSEYSAFFP